MSFVFSSESVNLTGTEISVSCRRGDGEQVESTLDLNSFIGNLNGSFDLNSEDFNANSARVWLEDDHILHADLENSAQVMIPTTYDLNLSVAIDNSEGNLIFEKPSPSIRDSCSSFLLEGGILKGMCLGTDGKYHSSSIDLNNYVGNIDGVFVNGKSNFSLSARNIVLDTKDGICIRAQLGTVTDAWKDAVYNADQYIRNVDGSFRYDYTAIAETSKRLLVTDYTKALLDLPYPNSDDDQARHAIAICVNSAPFAAGLRLCELFGGVLGATVCAGLATTVENFFKKVELGKGDSHSDERFRTISVERAILKTLVNVLSDDAITYLDLWLAARLSSPSIDKRDVAAYKTLKNVLQYRTKDVVLDDTSDVVGDTVDKKIDVSRPVQETIPQQDDVREVVDDRVDKSKDILRPVQEDVPRPDGAREVVDDRVDKRKDILGPIQEDVPQPGFLGDNRGPIGGSVDKKIDHLGPIQETMRWPGWIKRLLSILLKSLSTPYYYVSFWLSKRSS